MLIRLACCAYLPSDICTTGTPGTWYRNAHTGSVPGPWSLVLVPGTRYQGTSQEWYLVPDCHVLLTGNIPVDSKYGVVSVHAAYSAQMEQNRGT